MAIPIFHGYAGRILTKRLQSALNLGQNPYKIICFWGRVCGTEDPGSKPAITHFMTELLKMRKRRKRGRKLPIFTK